MLTQREKLKSMIARMETHDYFNEPFKISRADAQIILRSLNKHYTDLCYGHDNYLNNRDKKLKKAKARYQENKEQINEQKRRRIFKQAEKAVRGRGCDKV